MTLDVALLVKATIALVAGLLAAALAGRARASVRHLLLAATLGVLAALPLVAAIVPGVSIAIEVDAPPSTSTPVTVSGGSAQARPEPGTWNREPGTAPFLLAAASPTPPALSWPGILRLIWAAGVALLLGVLVRGLWRVHRIRRTGIPWPAGQAVADRLAGDAAGRLTIVVHEAVPAPVTCGWRHPFIVLPSDAREWPATELERAFVHELEHVRRGDWPLQLAARAVCAVYWFHPLVWVAWRRLCLECERACDDAVVAEMERTDYAEQLVALARRLAQHQVSPLLSMANRSDLSVRVRAVLDATQLRGRAGASAVIATVVMAAAFSLILAPMRVQAVPGEPAGAPAAAAPQNPRVGNVTASPGGARPGVLGRALVEAASEDDIDGVRGLIDAGADVNAVVQGDGTALLIAAREGNRAMVELLLQDGAVDIGVRGDGSALMMAAREGYQDIVRLLIDGGADVNLAVRGDGSALILAAREGYRDIARMLLERGADVNLAVAGDGNPLIMAAREGYLEIARMLLDHGALVNEVVPGDENAIINASGEGYLDIVKLLVSRGADVNSRVWVEQRWPDPRGEWRTPLGKARENGHTEVVRYLQSVGAVD